MTASTIGPDLTRPLRRARPRLLWATGLDGAMAGPVTHGGRRLVVTELQGMLTTTMRGLVATPGMGAGGKALQLARPVAVNDYLHSTAVSHHFDRKVALEQVRGVVAVPVGIGRDLRAVIYGVARSTEPLGDRVLDAAASVAASVGRELAVEVEVARRLRIIDADQLGRERRRAADELREIHEELRSIAHATSDPALRERLTALCDRTGPPSSVSAPDLTDRERQVLALVALGRTNLDVADQLALMPTTVKTYLKNAMRKLGTRNRVETIHAARCAGLLR